MTSLEDKLSEYNSHLHHVRLQVTNNRVYFRAVFPPKPGEVAASGFVRVLVSFSSAWHCCLKGLHDWFWFGSMARMKESISWNGQWIHTVRFSKPSNALIAPKAVSCCRNAGSLNALRAGLTGQGVYSKTMKFCQNLRSFYLCRDDSSHP